MIKLLLDNFLVPGYGLTVANTFQIASEDMSGKSSSTTTAENGFKPKSFSVSCTIRFIDAEQLTNLQRVAMSVDMNGTRQIFTASHPLIKAMNVRQVRFTDTFSVTPESGKQAWNISFTLKEYDSTAEKMEARTNQSSTVAQKGSGAGVTPGALDAGSSAAVSGNNTNGAGDGKPQLTDFEKLLKKVDTAIGGKT